MAFTPDEKVLIRNVLGFSELYHQTDTRLETQLEALPVNNPNAAAAVSARLVKIQSIDAQIIGSIDDLDLVKADEVTVDKAQQLTLLRGVGRTIIQQIGITFDLVPIRDYYADEAQADGLFQMG